MMLNNTPPIPLPDIWQAVGYDTFLPKGRTLPLVLTCERRRADGESEEKQFVTKAIGHPNISDIDLFAELFGNLLAQHFGLTTCEPHIIAFTDDFIAASAPLLLSKVRLRSGYGVGCVFDPPLYPIVADFKIPVPLLKQAATLYALDLLANNPDRKRTNSNCAVRDGQLIVFDFNEMFGFLNSTYRPPSWKVASNGLAPPHICRPSLRAYGADWTAFIAALKLLNEPQMRSLVKDFPVEWQVRLQDVIDHLLAAQSKSSQLQLELQRSLTI